MLPMDPGRGSQAKDYDIPLDLPIGRWHRFETRVGIADECLSSQKSINPSSGKRTPTYPWSMPKETPKRKEFLQLLVLGLGVVWGCWKIHFFLEYFVGTCGLNQAIIE